MRKVLLAALCSTEPDFVVDQLGSPVGLNQLRIIMSSPFVCDAGSKQDEFSFQNVAVPLCRLLSEPSLMNSPSVSACKRIIAAAISHEAFILRYFDLAERLANSSQPVGRGAARPQLTVWTPTTLLDVVEPIVRLVGLILTRLPDEPAQVRWPALLTRLRALVSHDRVANNAPGEHLARYTEMVRDLARAEQLVEHVVRGNLARDNARAAFAEMESERLAQELQTGAEMPLETEPPPGELRELGARHDNDKVDFRAIRVLPTADEVMCRIAPYLPLQDASAPHLASPFVAGAVDRHLDVQFRLLREDMLAPVRRAIQAFVDRRPLAHLAPTAATFVFDGEDADGQRDRVLCALFRKVSLEEFDANVHNGVCVVLKFDQHCDLLAKKGRPAAKKAARAQFWKDGFGSRLLQPDSLCVIALNAPVTAAVAAAPAVFEPPLLLLATVLPYGRDELGADAARCTLRVRPLGNDVAIAMDYMLVPPRANCEHVLFQVRGHFYQGFEAVLRALQRQDVTRLPFLERIAPTWIVDNNMADEIGLEPRPPAWVTAHTRYNLSCLVKPGERVPPELLAVAPNNADAVSALLAQHADRLVLDDTQIRAMALALCREVALIIGPPGTGKSYVGVHIVSVLLRNSAGRLTAPMATTRAGVVDAAIGQEQPHIGPILCICYTNHALDQFLEHLVDDKIVALDGIVRIGGRSRSEKIVGRNLANLSNSSPSERYQWAMLNKSAEKVKEEIRKKTKLVESGAPTDRWLQEYDPDLYKSIMSPYAFGDDVDLDDNDDNNSQEFSIVGGFPAACAIWRAESDAHEMLWRGVEECYLAEQREELRLLIDRFNNFATEAREINDKSSIRVLRNASIVAMTTSGAAKYDSLLHALRPRAIICEEAGEVFEAHVLASLTSSTQSLVLIGDDKQLRPKPSEYRLSVETSNLHNLDVSMFERLVKERRTEHCELSTQRRMRPEIADLIRHTLYKQLRDHAVVLNHPPAPRGFDQPVWFLDHEHREASDQGSSSKSNVWEAEMAVALVRYVVRQGYKPHEIAVLTPYVGQLQLLRRLLSKQHIMLFVGEVDLEAMESVDNNNNDDDDDNDDNNSDAAGNVLTDQLDVQCSSESLQRCVRLSTVDNFQGEEAEIVILSTVRNGGSTGFLAVSNRVNVMLSRAKQGMFVLGSVSTIRHSKKSTMMNSVLNLLESADRVGPALPLRCTVHNTVVEAREPADVSPDGGCRLVCGARRQCGHTCKRDCHPDDRIHAINDCRERCARVRQSCGHQCAKLCSVACGDVCDVLASVTRVQCGHAATLHCSVARSDESAWPVCNELARGPVKMRFCEHTRNDVRCSDVSRASCIAICGALLQCGHTCRRRCIDCNRGASGGAPRHGQCEQPCERVLMCGHECGAVGCHPSAECRPCAAGECVVRCEHSTCPKICSAPCAACAEQCTWRCKHQQCAMPCASMCVRPLCNERCDKPLACGHRCPSVCGEPCVSAAFCVVCARENRPATTRTRNAVVDMFGGETLAEIDVDDESGGCALLVLRCGHAWTRDTLDGVCYVAKFYNSDGSVRDEITIGDDDWAPRCPSCKTPVAGGGVRRYSRVLSYFNLIAAQRKWKIDIERRAGPLRARIAAAAAAADAKEQGRELAELQVLVAALLRDATVNAPTRVVYARERASSVGPLVKPIAAPELIALEVSLREMHLLAVYHCARATAGAKKSVAFIRKTMATRHARIVELAQESHSVVRAVACKKLFVGALLDICGALVNVVDALQLRQSLMECVDAELSKGNVDAELVEHAAKVRRALIAAPLTDEERRAIFAAMAPDVGSGFGSFGGHWFECPNGHPYTIGECGGAMQTSKCPECGEAVGGDNHSLLATNRPARNFADMQDGRM
jgi:hypothetical protein